MAKVTGENVFEQSLADPMYMSMLEVEEPSKKDIEMIEYIKKYVDSQVKNDSTLEPYNVLKDIKFRIGAPRMGENKLSQIHRYVKLRSEAKLLNQQAQDMEI